VITAQPVTAATATGTSSGSGTTARCDTTARSAKHETPRKWCTCSSPRRSREVPSINPPERACTRP
jgi:hypothetical protein